MRGTHSFLISPCIFHVSYRAVDIYSPEAFSLSKPVNTGARSSGDFLQTMGVFVKEWHGGAKCQSDAHAIKVINVLSLPDEPPILPLPDEPVASICF